MRTVIVGCGYIGIELGRQLQSAGSEVTSGEIPAVTGVRRSDAGLETVAEAGFTPMRADATDPGSLTELPDADVVVFAASSGGRGAQAAEEIYVDGLSNVIEEYAARDDPPDRLVYISSTGVYGDHDGGWVDESTPIDPTTEKTRVLADAEQLALNSCSHGIDGTVVRFAGLYGPDRYRLSRYLEGPVTDGYLNMVHRTDAAGSIRYLLRESLGHDEVVLVCDDEPAHKWRFADWLAEQCDCEPPEKQTKAERLAGADLSEPARRRIHTSKRCDNDRLRQMGYKFDYPTYRDGYQDAVESYRETAPAGRSDGADDR